MFEIKHWLSAICTTINMAREWPFGYWQGLQPLSNYAWEVHLVWKILSNLLQSPIPSGMQSFDNPRSKHVMLASPPPTWSPTERSGWCWSLLDQTRGCVKVASSPFPCTFPALCCATSPLDNHKLLASSRCHACQAPWQAVHRDGWEDGATTVMFRREIRMRRPQKLRH